MYFSAVKRVFVISDNC